MAVADANRRALLKWLVYISRFGLAALFLLTAAAKLFTIRDFAGNVSNLVGLRWSWPATIAIITAEIIATVLLTWRRTAHIGGLWSAALLMGFAAYALYYVYILHGEPLECGCFGRLIASQLGVKTALRNLALLIPAAIVIFGHTRKRREGTSALEPQHV